MTYKLVRGKVYVDLEDTGTFEYFSEPIIVSEVRKELVSGDVLVEIKFLTAYGKERITLPRKAIANNIIPDLVTKGFTCVDSAQNREILQEILYNTEKVASYHYFHSKLGFAEIDGVKCFLSYNPVGLIDKNKMQSKYINGKVRPIGTFKSWRKLICREVIGRPNIELALALGALAPVSHLLREANVVPDVPLVSLVGESSSGKTTVMRIIASMYGKASVGNGLISNMNSTQNGIYAQLANNFGAPALFDEITGATTGFDFSNMLYFLPNGRDKVRCNSDGTLKEPIEFSGAIFFSGERSLFPMTIQTNGLHARLFELTLNWTASRQNAENLERGLRTKNGTAVYPLIKWLLKREKWLEETYYQEYETLRSIYNSMDKNADNISDRVLKICAQIIVVAQAASVSLDLPLSIENMRWLILRCVKVSLSSKVSLEDEFEEIKSLISVNRCKFPEYGRNSDFLTSAHGFTKRTLGVEEFWIEKIYFEELVSKVSIRDLSHVVRDFVKRGWLYEDKSRHRIFKNNMAGMSMQFYRLRADGVLLDLQENRMVKDEIIAGTFLVVGFDEHGYTVSLSDEDILKYKELFWNIEIYANRETLKAYWNKFE